MKVFGLIAALLIVSVFVFWKVSSMEASGTAIGNAKKSKQKDDTGEKASASIVVKQQWDLPDELKEVSGISFLAQDRFACVQDELGTIFIYNTSSGKIEKQIPFAAAGDYEGVAVKEDMAYIVRADGRLYEVNMKEGIQSSRNYATHLTVDQNVEGLCLDSKRNRLLLAIKGDEPGNKNYKGIYSFDLSSKTMGKEPVYKIDLGDNIFASGKSKKNKAIMPSEIAIHPVNGDLYISDGPGSRLLVMDQSGRMKALYNLGKKFAQPEGISFSPTGDLFISNEGNKQSGNIIQVSIE
jgi:uncharacterized protein YjiK